MTKKILQINSVVNTGSTGRIAEGIGQAAMSVGWESYIAYGRNERPSTSKTLRIGSSWDLKLHGIQTRLFDNHGLASDRATNKFINDIELIKPNIIHLHNIHGYYLNYNILFEYLNKTNIPIVWTLHDCWPITGHCIYFTYVGCEKWKTECYKCPQKKEYPASWIFDRSRKNYILKKSLFKNIPNLTLIPVSDWLSGLIKISFLKDKPTKVIHNGIDTNVFRPTSGISFRMKHKLQDKFIILGIANIWEPRKGLKDFFDLSILLNDQFQIVLVGLNSRQIKQLPNNIIGIKRTESVNELVELYQDSDVFVNPTYEDNFPTTNLESLACGTPVITYKTGGSPEAIDDSTGIIVEQGNIIKLVDAINEIKSKGKMYYSDACVERAHRLYRKEDRYKEYIDLYESLIK
ncbi:glycosyltransferase [Lascolabacillus massiliensis]|uniref:glycosyltransferase n=1 Tax=Lascolabacillus massiliensis TaxID=1627894 RepID=UPI0006B38618|nr:glycosyltransferase [Lascolabacillus massiliensis]